MHTTRAQVVAWMATAWLASAAAAQPVVRIGAQARIELAVERRTEGGLILKARLLDDQDRPLAGLGLSLQAQTPSGQRIAGRYDLRTTREGEIQVEVPGGVERIVAMASFEGDPFHPSVRQEAVFDLGLAPVELSFTEAQSSVIDLSRSKHPVTVRARCEAGANAIEVVLHDEGDRVLARAVTDEYGVARFDLAPAQLGAPGLGKLSARTFGDAGRAPSAAEMAIVRWSATSVALELESHDEGGLDAWGTLRAGTLPVPRATVSIFSSETHVASFVTDKDGRFTGAISATQLAPETREEGNVELRARYVSDVPWLGSSESTARQARLETTLGLRQLWALATPIVIGLLLLALRRSGARAPAPLDAPRVAGVSPGHALRLRSASLSISFVVVDARSGRPIRDAHAILTAPGSVHGEADASGHGALEITAREAGEHLLEVRAPGFRSLECAVRTPHRGEWTRAIVRLESLRDAALAAWHPVAAQLVSNTEGASSSTVRETLERAAHQAHVAPGNALVLVDATERAAYARSTPSVEEVARVEQQAATMARAIEDKRKT